MDSVNEELNKISEEVAKEVDGKTPEELKAMEEKARAELQKAKVIEAKTYVYNLLKLGNNFSEEEFNNLVEKIKAERSDEELNKLFARFSDEDEFLNENTLLLGYGNFGHKFVEELVDQDPASAKVLLETATQCWLDLRYQMEYFNQLAEQLVNKKEEKNKPKENN